MTKTLHNSDISGAHKNVSDLNVVGNGDMFQLLCKASSKEEGWMKSTKAMEIPGVGCVVQVTTQQDGQVAEALTFVPGVAIVDDPTGLRKLELVQKKESKNMAISDITENLPHDFMTVVCPYCMRVWVAVFPKNTKALECPRCGKMSGIPEQPPVLLLKN